MLNATFTLTTGETVELIASGPDVERFRSDVDRILASINGQHSQPAPVQVVESKSSDQAPGQPLNLPSPGTDAAAGARFARSQYAAFSKIAGRKPSDEEKAQLKAGADPASVAGNAQPVQAPTSTVDAGTAALQQQLADLQAKIAAAGQPSQPAAQPAKARVKFDSIPPSAQLSQAVCNELQVWAQSLTGDMATGRKGAVVAYATGQPNGVQRIMDTYGAKLPKFLGKLNTLVNA